MGLLNFLSKKLPSTKINELKKQLEIAMTALFKPISGGLRGNSVYLYPKFPYSVEILYDFSYNSDTLTVIHNALKREIFRNGYDLIPAKDKDETVTTSEAHEQLSGDEKKILDFFENVNENEQSLIDVLYELEDDFSIMDDAFMLLYHTYYFNNKGEIIKKELDQIKRMDPRYSGLIINKYDQPAMTDDGTKLYVCPVHRHTLLEGEDVCPVCGKKAYPAYYFSESEGEKTHYFKWEVIHRSKYRPSKRRGFSPVVTTWMKTRTLFFMDKYIMELYDGQRPPKAGLFFKTSNVATLTKAWEEAQQRAEENPHLPVVMGVPDSTNGQGFVEFIDFMKSLDELQHTEMRNEFRRQVGAVYGVEPIFQNDTSTSGGLNNEGLQVTVTNRAVEYGQWIYNKHFFPKILDALGVKGYVLMLRPSEEQDEMSKLQRQYQALQNGQLALSLGLEAEYNSEIGEVVIKDGDLEKQEQDFGYNQGYGESEETSSPETGEPESPESPDELIDFKKKNDLVYKGKIPPGAMPLSSGEKPPKGSKVITGPKGGKYYIPTQGSVVSDGSDSLSMSELMELAKQKFSEVKPEDKKKMEEAVKAFKEGKDSFNKYYKEGSLDTARFGILSTIHAKYSGYAEKAKPKSGKPTVVFMAGLPAAGKTTATSNFLKPVEGTDGLLLKGADDEYYLVLNADDIKKYLPEFENGVGAAMVHKESSKINADLIEKFMNKKINIVIDGTMANKEKATNQLKSFKELGYSSHLFYVDTPPDVAIERAHNRYLDTGRLVPYDLIPKFHPQVLDTIETLKSQFDGYKRINNLSEKPKIVEEF